LAPLDYDFLPNHDCRGRGQLQLEVLVCVVFSLGLGGELETWSPFVVDKRG
jgi:hypothetical protein